jgi:hypothetical protein
MTTPSVFKIVSLSSPSAFEAKHEPKQKANPPQCGTFTLPLNNGSTPITLGGTGVGNHPPLNLAGICKVVLPLYTDVVSSQHQYIIQSVS